MLKSNFTSSTSSTIFQSDWTYLQLQSKCSIVWIWPQTSQWSLILTFHWFKFLLQGNIPCKTLKLNSLSLISFSNETFLVNIYLTSSVAQYCLKNFVVEGILAVILFSSNEYNTLDLQNPYTLCASVIVSLEIFLSSFWYGKSAFFTICVIYYYQNAVHYYTIISNSEHNIVLRLNEFKSMIFPHKKRGAISYRREFSFQVISLSSLNMYI